MNKIENINELLSVKREMISLKLKFCLNNYQDNNNENLEKFKQSFYNEKRRLKRKIAILKRLNNES
jgi:hypothetical protein